MAPAAYNLGVLLCQKNDKEGLPWLESAATEMPENWDYTSSCLYFLHQEGRSMEMEQVLKRVIDTGRASPQAYFALAGRYEREGRLEEAAAICRKAKLAGHLSMDAKNYAAQMERRLRASTADQP
jgi:hypothetical protein